MSFWSIPEHKPVKPRVPRTYRNSAKNDLIMTSGTSLYELISLEYWASNTHIPFSVDSMTGAYGMIVIKDKKYSNSDEDAISKHKLAVDVYDGIPHIVVSVPHTDLKLSPGKYYYTINLCMPADGQFPFMVDSVVRGKLKVKASTIVDSEVNNA